MAATSCGVTINPLSTVDITCAMNARCTGLQGVYRSPQTTSRGQPLVDVEGYAASPERLPGRDTFLGNGGSVYFLQRQDITVDSENLSVQLRDRNTGRVVETRQLTPGRDYSINHIQGTIILSAPLSGRSATGAVVSDPSGDFDVILVANYAYTPATGEIDGYTYGGRAEAWVNDNIRLGFSGMVEQTDIADETDIADQTAQSVDLLWELGDRSFVALEYARTEGPGFGSSLSIDGGLIVENRETAGLQDGAGDAFAARMQLDLGDLGHATRGTIAAYSETRGAGFSTLDYETTVDEDLWGLSFDDQPSDWLSYRFYYDNFADADGKTDRKALSFGARHENETGLSLSGRVELRRDRGETQETDRDSDALFFVGSGRYIINDDQRLVFSLDYADTDTDGASLSSGEYYDAQAGYAYRPALDDRLNMLFRAVRHAQ